MDGAKRGLRRFGRRLRIGRPTYVTLARRRPAACTCDHMRRLICGPAIDVEAHDRSAGRCKNGGDGAADSTAGAGDDRRFVVKL
jgi:hypothetical protein